MTNKNSLQGRYTHFDNQRSSVLDRARDCAALTIPGILPPSGHTQSSPLPTPYQSLGARGANNLASKLLLALFPPNSAFFRFVIDDASLVKLAGDEELRAEVEKALAKLEQTLMMHIETSNLRTIVFEVLKHLIITGNALLMLPKKGGSRIFDLAHYVIRRDGSGNVLEIITKESVSPEILPDNVRTACGVTADDEKFEDVDIYTQYLRKDNMWHIRQEINEVQVPGTSGTVPLDDCPAVPLRFMAVAGESYGRGLIEEYFGDLRSLEGLTKSIVIASAASAKVLFLLKPNSTTRLKDLEKDSGSVISGDERDVSVLQVQKHADLRVAREVINDIIHRLSQAFLLNASIQRNAERVTAEEIRMMAQELEDAHGGVYSVLSQELQLPIVKRKMNQLQKAGTLPPLPKELVRPMITTGLEALGRGHDVARLRAVIEDMAVLGPEVIQTYLNVGNYLTQILTARGIKSEGLVRSEQEVKAIQQQQMMAQMGQDAGPGVIQEVVKQMGENSRSKNG